MLSSIERPRASPSLLRSSLRNPTPWAMRARGRGMAAVEDAATRDPSRDDRLEPEDGAQQRGSARADQSRDARGSRRAAAPGSPGVAVFRARRSSSTRIGSPGCVRHARE